jgi:ankyrin repeat protein
MVATACATRQVRLEYAREETDALTDAVWDKNLQAARAALAKGGDPNYLYQGTTPLFFKALRLGTDWAEAFADAGVDINLQDWKKNTALIAMVDQRNHEAMRWLIRRDADLNHRSFHGHTALLLAYIHQDATSIAMLKKAGRKRRYLHAFGFG